MPCESVVTSSLVKPTSCSTTVGGMRDKVYVINVSEITSMTPASTLGRISDITLAATKTIFYFEVEKDSFIPREELQEDGTYTQFADWKLANDTHTERNWVQLLKNGKVILVGRTKNDTFPIVGVDYRGNTTTPANSTAEMAGVKMATNVNTWAKDEFGNTIGMTAPGMIEKIPYLFDTDAATTAALLEDLLTA